MQKSVAIAVRTFLLTGAAFLTVGCSRTLIGGNGAEAEFEELFGIAPLKSVDIRYHEFSSYFGGYQRWMSFKYDAATYDAILKKGDYKLAKVSMAGFGNTPNAPTWWPKSDPPPPPRCFLYSRSQDDTPADEGFQFREFMWHDASSDQVYYCKSYWD
ncbi:hypothetical protein JIN84_01345 [Luteolibacter yonseiensis]|uniref:Lipoprotein n=1 Tax=Luteolibacter yonseiensis TaxID=1144680 RepID=A0A934V5S2_9BACT|nr:hypothetical protein [Luteolibacter yonseiensis]MBK1814252.1 hypothetical protein [Luteolibacter yonseiensis]